MTTSSSSRGWWPTALAVGLTALALPGTALGAADILQARQGLADFDGRTGRVVPTAAQRSAVSTLGARATWTRFGTVGSLIRDGGYLASGLSGDPATVARSFVAAHQGLFGLSDSGVAGLQLVADTRLVSSQAHAVLLRQSFGGLPASQDGLISVGVLGDKVAYVSSSSAGDESLANSATLSAAQAWAYAAANVGRIVALPQLRDVTLDAATGWTTFTVPGFAQQQQARLVAFPTPGGGARAAFETNVVDVQHGAATAYTSLVDAQTGAVLFRRNAVQELARTDTFQGEYSATGCGPLHSFDVPAGTQTVDVVATASLATNDIVLHLQKDGADVASSDTATSPEAIHYAPAGGAVAGVYQVQVCPFPDPTAPAQAPYTYAGSFTTNDVATPQATPAPRWRYFEAWPSVDYSTADRRVTGCWGGGTGCDRDVRNIAARGPWDYDFRTGTPTLTTIGNAARTAEAWGSPLTPAEQYSPVAPDRNYSFAWASSWFGAGCNPTTLVPTQGADVQAAIANLFASHNRMHDFAYYLGFTETTWNLQDDNFGNTAPGPFPAGGENDPELGNVQAGALVGGAPTYEGRDNANQITLQDGIPGITNQYLFQPIAAAFYSPCVDGDLDMSVVGHEYTHAISNRMVGGPDSSLTGAQAGAMGESWSDLDAEELLHEYGLAQTAGGNQWAVGAYVTGNQQVGIRDYALDANPLNYSDVGFDTPGVEVHADGEIWNGVNYELRQAFVQRYDRQFPSSNLALQRDCANGVLPPAQCPGNRRWIQLVYDAFLLQQASTSMLDARDAFLAADQLRFGGADLDVAWRAFAQRGMGASASSNGTDDGDPVAAYDSPREANAAITFTAPAGAQVFVGDYSARITPLADTDPATALPAGASMVPGTYRFTVQAPGYGIVRLQKTIKGSAAQTIAFSLPANYASAAQGASVVAGDGLNQTNLIDDDEGTNWVRTGAAPSVAGSEVTVRLGRKVTVKYVSVSAMLHGADADDANDPDAQNRFTALRGFEIWTCNASAANGFCANPAIGYGKVYASPANAFPGVAPRPVAPDLILRRFAVPATAATHVQLRVVSNQCTGDPAFQIDDADPTNDASCLSSTESTTVRAAELEVFDKAGSWS